MMSIYFCTANQILNMNIKTIFVQLSLALMGTASVSAQHSFTFLKKHNPDQAQTTLLLPPKYENRIPLSMPNAGGRKPTATKIPDGSRVWIPVQRHRLCRPGLCPLLLVGDPWRRLSVFHDYRFALLLPKQLHAVDGV